MTLAEEGLEVVVEVVLERGVGAGGEADARHELLEYRLHVRGCLALNTEAETVH